MKYTWYMIKQIFLRRMVIVERMMTLVPMCRMVAWKWQDWGWILTWEGKVLQPNLWRNLKRYFRCIHLFHITHITHCWVLLFNNIKEHHTWCMHDSYILKVGDPGVRQIGWERRNYQGFTVSGDITQITFSHCLNIRLRHLNRVYPQQKCSFDTKFLEFGWFTHLCRKILL